MMDLNKLRPQRFLGLGCSTFGGSTATGAARASLDRAFEQGIVYFDVARSYGYGQAEGILGRFAQGKRDQVFIASKFGIVPPSIPFKPLVLWGLRSLRKALPASRQAMTQAGTSALAKTQFTPQLAESSLHTSLRELKTDYLDLFLLHEGSYADGRRDDIRAVLEQAKAKGYIRAWGATLSERGCLQQQIEGPDRLDAVQFPFGQDATYRQALQTGSAIQIVYSVLNYYQAKGLLGQPSAPATLAALKADFPALHFLNTLPELLLYLAFAELQSGVVLSSMTKPANIDRNIFLFNQQAAVPAVQLPAIQARLMALLSLAPETVQPRAA
jgi:hypothetical protein